MESDLGLDLELGLVWGSRDLAWEPDLAMALDLDQASAREGA